MYGQKLCLATGVSSSLTEEEQIMLYKRTGFDGFFVGYGNDEHIQNVAALAKRENMIFQSIHAPFGRVDKLWLEGEDGEIVLKELIDCVESAAKAGVEIVVSHVWIGFDRPEKPGALGLDRFGKLVRLAADRGVKIAFENTEGEEFLAAIMDAFKNEKHVGFCWDTGHEQCYNMSKDMTALYGDRLIATHINDNLGVSDFGGHTFWLDDLHLLPFDGIIDWTDLAARLNKCGYNGYLTFELNRNSKPNRHDNDKYCLMTDETYVAEAYARACRLAFIKKRRVEKNNAAK